MKKIGLVFVLILFAVQSFAQTINQSSEPLTKEVISKKLEIYIIDSKNSIIYRFIDTKTREFKGEIKNCPQIDLDSVRIIYGSNEVPISISSKQFSFKIDPCKLGHKDSLDVKIIFNVKGQDSLSNISKVIGKVIVDMPRVMIVMVWLKKNIWYLAIGIILVVLLILLGIRRYCVSKNFSMLRLKNVHNQTIKIKLSGEFPQINDKASPNGWHETEDGHIYEISEGKLKSIKLKLRGHDSKDDTIVTLTAAEPRVGDSASRNGTFYWMQEDALQNGIKYIVADGKIAVIEKSQPKTVEELQIELAEAQKINNQLADQFKNADRKLREAEGKLKNLERVIADAENRARADERKKADSKHKREINENYVTIICHKEELWKVEIQKEETVQAKEKVEKSLRVKENALLKAENEIKEQAKVIKEQKEEIIRQKAFVISLKESTRKKNTHYLFEVEDALSDISSTFKEVYKSMTNETIKDGLINPMLRGVSGLSAGILSWAEDFTVKVKEDTESFFGQEFLAMNQEGVKEILARKFISNIVKSDSFSKFVRIYQLSTVPNIRKQLVEANMNLDLFHKLYYKLYTLVTDFGYTIICPVLFEEQHDDQKYQWFNSTNLYSVLTFTAEDKAAIKAKGPDTIIDVNQIGFTSPWASRKATVVTPDF